MKASTLLAGLAILALPAPAAARGWPEWLPVHVRELRFRDGVPGKQLRAATDRGEIEKILAALRTAQPVKKVTWWNRLFGRKSDDRTFEWQVCMDVIGERPEAGRWLLNLETGEATFLDAFVQPVYRVSEDGRRTLGRWFRREPEQADGPPASAEKGQAADIVILAPRKLRS